LGNDSSLALSTTFTSIRSGNQLRLFRTDNGIYGSIQYLTGAGGFKFDDANGDGYTFAQGADTRLAITSTGNVGIGTSTPVAKLQTTGADAASVITGVALENFIATNPSAGNGVAVDFRLNNSGNTSVVTGKISTVNTFFRSNTDMVFSTFTSDNLTEKVRIQSGGGISFNGDTAAANALDDYEEGTFTPTIVGSTTAGTATYGGGQSGTYTKIGNVVYFNIYLGYSAGTGTGDLRIAGLPFTIPASDLPSFTFGVFLNVALTALNVPIAGGIGSTTQIYINQIPTGGGAQTSVPYDDSAVIQISGFYRV
jgi:hypothetical protein